MCVHAYVSVCTCGCVSERESECVCVCVTTPYLPLIPSLQLWEDKEAKAKLSKINARVSQHFERMCKTFDTLH